MMVLDMSLSERTAKLLTVLILVLLDDGLGLNIVDDCDTYQERLNPCSIG